MQEMFWEFLLDLKRQPATADSHFCTKTSGAWHLRWALQTSSPEVAMLNHPRGFMGTYAWGGQLPRAQVTHDQWWKKMMKNYMGLWLSSKGGPWLQPDCALVNLALSQQVVGTIVRVLLACICTVSKRLVDYWPPSLEVLNIFPSCY